MYSLTAFIMFFDPWFIAPFRWLPSPTAGFVLGTVILCLYCFILGDLSAILVTFLNRKFIRKIQKNMDRNHTLSETALKMGDKASYKAVNRQALEAFGHSFSLGAAIFCVSIWPMPFALAWMDHRFSDAPLELSMKIPFLGNSVHYFASFLLLYIAVRMTVSSILHRFEWYSGFKARLAGQNKNL